MWQLQKSNRSNSIQIDSLPIWPKIQAHASTEEAGLVFTLNGGQVDEFGKNSVRRREINVDMTRTDANVG